MIVSFKPNITVAKRNNPQAAQNNPVAFGLELPKGAARRIITTSDGSLIMKIRHGLKIGDFTTEQIKQALKVFLDGKKINGEKLNDVEEANLEFVKKLFFDKQV